MSGAITGLATVGTFALPALEASGLLPAWIRQTRAITPTSSAGAVSAIIPDVTIEEQHTDRLQVTQHPVAQGSPISDHAYRLPATLTMRMGWTNANPVGAFVGGAMMGGLSGGLSGLWSAFTETRAREVYNTLRALQGDVSTGSGADVVNVQPTLLDITTGKRKYTNMVLVELGVRTDHTTEYSLMVEAHFQEVIMAHVTTTTTTTTTQPTSTAAPDKTTPTADTSTQQPAPVSNDTTAQILIGNPLGIGGYTKPPAPIVGFP